MIARLLKIAMVSLLIVIAAYLYLFIEGVKFLVCLCSVRAWDRWIDPVGRRRKPGWT